MNETIEDLSHMLNDFLWNWLSVEDLGLQVEAGELDVTALRTAFINTIDQWIEAVEESDDEDDFSTYYDEDDEDDEDLE